MNIDNQVNNIKHVREIARILSRQEIVKCMDEQIETQTNSCAIEGEHTEVMNILSRASVVRQLVIEGNTLPEAIRELGRRMRNILEVK